MPVHKRSRTAQNIAVARAVLDHFGGPAKDPYARLMLRAPWNGIARVLCSPVATRAGSARLFGYLAARTLFFDEVVTTGIGDGATQVVIVGAGYDTRALRLASADVAFYEVDRPRTQLDKKQRLDGVGLPQPILVAADLAAGDLADRLAGAGFDASAPTVVICEGLTMYLSEPAVHDLLASLGDLTTAGITLGIDFALDESQTATGGRRPPAWLVTASNWLTTTAVGEPLRFRLLPSEVEPLLTAHNWRCTQVLDAHEVCDRYLQGTDLRRPPPGDWLELVHCARE